MCLLTTVYSIEVVDVGAVEIDGRVGVVGSDGDTLVLKLGGIIAIHSPAPDTMP
jgi:hypothetical protein